MFLLGLAANFRGRHPFLPRVTLLLLVGILVGDQVLGRIPATRRVLVQHALHVTLRSQGT